MERTEHGPTLLELVGNEADDIEGSVVDGSEADGYAGCHALGCCLDVGEVERLLSHLGHLTLYRELHVVGAVGDNLGTSYTEHQFEVVRQFDAGYLCVDDLGDGNGDESARFQVAQGVLVCTVCHGIGQNGGGVLALLRALLDDLAQLGGAVLTLADVFQLCVAGQCLGFGRESGALADECVIFGGFIVGELDVAVVSFARLLLHSVHLVPDCVLTLLDLCFCHFSHD